MIKQFKGKYRFLSNFWPSKLVLDGVEFDTVEHAYQAAKSNRVEDRKKFKECATPNEAKKMGRRIKIRSDWELIKLGVMEFLVNQKFYNSEELKHLLLATGDEELQEGNTWGDQFWGVDLKTGAGENNLGKILMRVREQLMRVREQWMKE